MKISFTPQNFKGYDAAPLKTLYMQTLTADIFRELDEIGKKEGFEVIAQYDGKLHPGPPKKEGWLRGRRKQYCSYNQWAQDSKLIIEEDGKSKIIMPGRIDMQDSCRELGRLTGMKIIDSQRFFKGGNMFLGKTEDGEPYLLAGEKLLTHFCAHLCIEREKGYNCGVYDLVEKNTGKVRHSWDEDAMSKYKDEALDDIAKTFRVKRKNVFLIPQPNYHIDMHVRPVGHPYVLIDSPKMAVDNAEGLFRAALDIEDSYRQNKIYSAGKKNEEIVEQDNLNYRVRCHYNNLREGTESYSRGRERSYAPMEKVKEKLIEQGFIPIEIGGIYGYGGAINFMNAIVNKHEDGTISYITNGTGEDSELEKLFEEQLREKLKEAGADGVRDVYFVQGEKTKRGDGEVNHIRWYLEAQGGGIHCFVCEEPNFKVWA